MIFISDIIDFGDLANPADVVRVVVRLVVVVGRARKSELRDR